MLINFAFRIFIKNILISNRRRDVSAIWAPPSQLDLHFVRLLPVSFTFIKIASLGQGFTFPIDYMCMSVVRLHLGHSVKVDQVRFAHTLMTQRVCVRRNRTVDKVDPYVQVHVSISPMFVSHRSAQNTGTTMLITYTMAIIWR